MPVRPWRTLSSEEVFADPWQRVRRDVVELPDGATSDYFVYVRAEIALVVALTPERELVLVRQYKHGIGEVTLELPGGVVDEGETPTAAAARELAEETGYAAPELWPLATLIHDPSKNTNRVHGFLARGVARVHEPRDDAMEQIEVVEVPVSEVRRLIAAGEIDAAHTVALLYRALDEL